MNHDSPIFLDPEHRRWKWVRLGFIAVGVVIFSIAGVLVSGVASEPKLPNLVLNLNHRILGQHSQAVSNVLQVISEQSEPALLKTKFNSYLPKTASRVIGFYVNWDDNSFTSLKQNIQNQIGRAHV